MSLVPKITIPKITLTQKAVTSGASRRTQVYKNELPLQLRHKKLLNFYKWSAGRGSSGRVVV
jgi:hypothetical protein